MQHHHIEPTIGAWYNSKDSPESFRVVASDSLQDTVEIQYFDGDIEELDQETWDALNPHEIAPPEDATAPYEMDREDILDLLNEIENSEDLESHLHHLDGDDLSWRD